MAGLLPLIGAGAAGAAEAGTIGAAGAAPAVGAGVGGGVGTGMGVLPTALASAATPAASTVPAASLMNTGIRLGDLANQAGQPQQQQKGAAVQAAPSPQPLNQAPMGQFQPSALEILQAFLQSRGR